VVVFPFVAQLRVRPASCSAYLRASPLAVYLCTIGSIAGVAYLAMHSLLHAMIGLLPPDDTNKQMSRVQRWAAIQPHRPPDPAVLAWARSEVPSALHIPVAAVIESEGAAMGDAATDSDLDQIPTSEEADAAASIPSSKVSAPATTYRTVCVRLCDGGYFPVSYAALPERFASDEMTCQSSCGAEARLFVYPNPGADPKDLVDLSGQPYRELPTAFQFQERFEPSCGCKAQSWTQEARLRLKSFVSTPSTAAVAASPIITGSLSSSQDPWQIDPQTTDREGTDLALPAQAARVLDSPKRELSQAQQAELLDRRVKKDGIKKLARRATPGPAQTARAGRRLPSALRRQINARTPGDIVLRSLAFGIP